MVDEVIVVNDIIDIAAAEALKDQKYAEGLAAYGDEVDRLTGPIWEKNYIRPEKERIEIRKAG